MVLTPDGIGSLGKGTDGYAKAKKQRKAVGEA